MSAILTPCGENIVQVSAWSEGDTYTHIRAGNLQQPGISCDTAADLPAQAGGLSGYYLEQDSCAHVIQDNSIYCIDSSGTWHEQTETHRFDAYTRGEVDGLIDNVNRYLSWLFMDGCKNLLNVWGQTSQTLNGILWTINSDGTVSASGTATADSTLYIWRNAFPPPLMQYPIIISGVPDGASETTFDIMYTSSASGTVSVTATREIAQSIAVTTTRLGLRVRSGQTVDITYSPMVCRKDIYQISPGFAPYAPTNAALYQLIRNYHP